VENDKAAGNKHPQPLLAGLTAGVRRPVIIIHAVKIVFDRGHHPVMNQQWTCFDG
jgi:hypothetical protein